MRNSVDSIIYNSKGPGADFFSNSIVFLKPSENADISKMEVQLDELILLVGGEGDSMIESL